MRTTDVVWRARQWQGVERLELVEGDEGVTARSVLIAAPEGEVAAARYEIVCDARWRLVRLSLESLGTGGRLELARGEGGTWTRDGKAAPFLAPATEVDIDLSPFTNTLPIRRLRLAPGAAAEIDVAYISLPALDVRPQRQRYTCVRHDAGGGLYRYEAGSFAADVAVDATGLVTHYEGLWDRS